MLNKNIKLDEVCYNDFNSVYEILESCMSKYPSYKAITDEHMNVHLTYGELLEQSNLVASALQSFGVKKGDCVALFSESNGRWAVMDLGVIKCGAIDVVRGSSSPIDELCYITMHADCRVAIFKSSKLLKKMQDKLKELDYKHIILMFDDGSFDYSAIKTPIHTFEEVLEIGRKNVFQPVQMNKEDVFTVIYTSGTTGMPKGVMLHNNTFVHQLKHVHNALQCMPGEKSLEILPVWHAYERIGLYYYLSRCCHMNYATLATFRGDLKKYNVSIVMSVPRIWASLRDVIYRKMQQKSPRLYKLFVPAVKLSIKYKTHKMYGERRITNKWSYNAFSTVRHKIIRSFLKPLHVLFLHTLYKKVKNDNGLNFRVILSGGGALSMRDELFYDAIGVNVRVAYGLSETAPIISLRHVTDKNFLGSVGTPVGEMEIKVVNPHDYSELGVFKQGLVIARGPQIMKGYLKDQKATDAVIDKDGWFNTGDLGWKTKDNNLVLVGRVKETIVLSSGENIEPIPIEEACLMSPYIDQIVLIGQDQAGLGALVVPSKKALELCGIELNDVADYKESMIDNSALQDLIKKEINSHIVRKPHLKSFEKIKQFMVIAKGFTVENGLMSATQKIKRNMVFEKYKDLINKMYEKHK